MFRAGLASILASPAVHAAQWSIQGSATTTTGADDNPGLRIDDAGTRNSLGLDAKMAMARRTETSELNVAPVVRLLRFPDERQLDSDEESLDAGYVIAHERWSLDLSASGGRQSTLTSELGTTGRTDINAASESASFGLAPQWQLTERLSAGANLGYQRAAYPGIDSSRTDLYGSRYTTGQVSARYALDPAMSLAIATSAGHFDSQRPGGSSDSRDLTAIFDYAIAERLALTLSAGPSVVATRHRTDHGVVYTASLQRTFTLSNLSFSAARSVSPSGYGVLTRRDDLNFSWSGQLTERTSANLGLSGIRSREVLPELGFNLSDVRYLRADAGVQRQIGEQWSLSLGVAGLRQDFYQRKRTANGYQASLAVNWSGRNHEL